MAKIERFEDLNCWKASRELVILIFEVCEVGKLAKDFDVRSQLRRAALSTMNNIAEGFGRKSKIEFIRFLEIAQSSAIEILSMLYVLEDLNYLDSAKLIQIRKKTEQVKDLALA